MKLGLAITGGGAKTGRVEGAEYAYEREFNLVRLNLGKTIEDAQKWFESGQNGPAPLVFLGAMQSIPSGSSMFLTLDLEQGGNTSSSKASTSTSPASR
jgi:hypothetical protein